MPLKMAGSEIKMMLEFDVAINTPAVAFESAIHLYRSCRWRSLRCSSVPLALPSIAMRFHSIFTPVLVATAMPPAVHLVIVLVYYRATFRSRQCHTTDAYSTCIGAMPATTTRGFRSCPTPTTSHLRQSKPLPRSRPGNGMPNGLLLQPGRHKVTYLPHAGAARAAALRAGYRHRRARSLLVAPPGAACVKKAFTRRRAATPAPSASLATGLTPTAAPSGGTCHQPGRRSTLRLDGAGARARRGVAREPVASERFAGGAQLFGG